jgi:hypothetical protein
MADKRKIDIALVMKTKDENGKPYTRRMDDGQVVPDPMITTRNFGVPDDVEIRFSLWDLDAQVLMPLMSGTPSQDDFDTFFRTQHERMQELVRNGQVDSMIRSHEDRRRIAELESQVGSNRHAAGND